MPAGIVVQVNRDARPVDPDAFDRVTSSLSYLSHDGGFSRSFGNIALSYQRLDVTPHRFASRYPDGDDGVFVLLAGRLDHREELGASAGVPHSSISDTELIRTAYLRHGPRFIERIRGSAAVVVVDPGARRVVAGRDALGKEILYFYLSPRVLLLASEPQALLRHPEVTGGLDARWLAAHFSLARFSAGRRTPFLGVEALLPGETLIWTPDGVECLRYRPRFGGEPVRYGRDEEYAEHFRRLLTRSVERSVIGNGNIGIMLSGGMDSCPVATLAAAALAGRGQTLKAYCWSLPGYPEADETRKIKDCAGYAGVPVDFFSGDALALFDAWETWPVDLNTPISNAFLRLFLSIYQRAADDGVRVLLQGTFGDQLYSASRYWLADAVRDRRFSLAHRELAWVIHHGGVRGLWENPGVRHLIKRLIRYTGNRRSPPQWLTPSAASLLEPARNPQQGGAHPRPDQYETLLGDDVFAQQIGHGVYQHRQGVVRVDPYHDWDLIAYMLSVPAYQCYREGQTKYLARLGMRGHMPEGLRTRPRGSLLNSFFASGFERSRAGMLQVLTDPGCSWQDYVHKDCVDSALSGAPCSERDQLVAWWAFNYELWRGALAREGLLC